MVVILVSAQNLNLVAQKNFVKKRKKIHVKTLDISKWSQAPRPCRSIVMMEHLKKLQDFHENKIKFIAITF